MTCYIARSVPAKVMIFRRFFVLNHDNYVIFDEFVVSGQPTMIRVAYSVTNVEHTYSGCRFAIPLHYDNCHSVLVYRFDWRQMTEP
jgi:hypothetical protein